MKSRPTKIVILVTGLLLSLGILGARGERLCPDGMVPTGLGSCIDRFEWPNKQGVRPTLGLSGEAEEEDLAAGLTMDAERLCASVGKRVCDLKEWIAACRGENRAPYPFGNEVSKYTPGEQAGLCNYDKIFRTPNEELVFRRDPKEMRRLDQSEPGGSRETCQSASGTYDMMGNAEEWVRCPGKGEYGWCLMGRFWSSPEPCSNTITTHAGKWHYYESGTRCCSD